MLLEIETTCKKRVAVPVHLIHSIVELKDVDGPITKIVTLLEDEYLTLTSYDGICHRYMRAAHVMAVGGVLRNI